MKILKITFLSLMLLFSCKDDDDSVGGLSDSQSAALEERNLDVNKVFESTKININGDSNSDVRSVKTILASEIPATTDQVKIVLPQETQTAFQSRGLELKISGSQQFDGVYIRVKDANGNLSDEVLEVALSGTNNNFSKVQKNKFLKTQKVHTTKQSFLSKANKVSTITVDEISNEETEKTIDIDFTGLEPGKFCYAICVYVNNADGNGGQWVSQPGDICVEVEAWGGNRALVRNWKFKKLSYIFSNEICEKQNGEEYICTKQGEEDTGSWENNVEREEEESFCGDYNKKYISKNLINVSKFELKSNGTFIIELSGYSDTTYDYRNEEATNSSECFDEPMRNFFSEVFSGNWAYNEEKEELTIVTFKHSGTASFDDNFDETYEEGDLWIDAGKVTLNGNVLTIISEYVESYNSSSNTKSIYKSIDTITLSR